MSPRVIEGPWDEVLLRADELVGKRVRVTVLEGPPPRALDVALQGLLEAAEELSRSGPFRSVEPSGEWGEGVAAKFRSQGFDL